MWGEFILITNGITARGNAYGRTVSCTSLAHQVSAVTVQGSTLTCLWAKTTSRRRRKVGHLNITHFRWSRYMWKMSPL